LALVAQEGSRIFEAKVLDELSNKRPAFEEMSVERNYDAEEFGRVTEVEPKSILQRKKWTKQESLLKAQN
jgi:hypothetical protein